MTKDDMVVYADFNCPYCYVLSERLLDSEWTARLQWRTIEQKPTDIRDVFSPEEQSRVEVDVFTLRHRVPDIRIALPPGRPNTALANRLLFNVCVRVPHLTHSLRRLIFRALWDDGKDISSTKVLLDLLAKAGFDQPFDPEQLFAPSSLLAQWQQAWEHDEFEGCVPTIVSNDRVIKGVSKVDDIKDFIGGQIVADDGPTSGHYIPRQHITIVGVLQAVWTLVEPLRHDYHFHVLGSTQALQAEIISEDPPDLLIIDLDNTRIDGMALCEQLKNNDQTHSIPLVLVADERPVEQEVHAYEIGVADYFQRDRSPQVFKARVGMFLQMKAAADALDKAARLDSLTQIYNRREFDQVIDQEWRRCGRSASELSLLMIDIDYFKKYNDFYGHLAGDGCIRMVARAMKESVTRVGDLVSRYGGEEFAVLLPNTDARGAFQMAGQIRRAINALNIPHQASDVAEHVTVSIGYFTMLPSQDNHPTQLIAGADKLLYAAKQAGRNCIKGKRPPKPAAAEAEE